MTPVDLLFVLLKILVVLLLIPVTVGFFSCAERMIW